MISEAQKEKIFSALTKSIPITITTHKVSRDTELRIEAILELILSEFGLIEVHDKISYCLKEIITNAKKANTKRIYFEKNGLRMDSPEDYKRGMTSFKEDTLSNIDYYLKLQEEAGLYVKISFHAQGSVLMLTVRNNSEISQKELSRVYDRMARARTYHSMEEAFSEILDDSEGAGLGIVIMVLMLKKIGLTEEAFEISVNDGVTSAALTLKMADVRAEGIELLIDEIVNGIDSIPQFPENIRRIQDLINDKDSSMTDIAKQISIDPAMTADVLKIVNSSQFMLPNKVENLLSAVSLIGMKGLRDLILRYGAQKTLKFEGSRKLWEHSHFVAFSAYSLARARRLSKDIAEDAFMGGILHDIGKAVFANISAGLMTRFEKIAKSKSLPTKIIEDLFAGYNHAEIGARIAEKWNFPDSLVSCIRYHHDPLKCKKGDKGYVFAVYLANIFAGYLSGDIIFEQIDPTVLTFFHINDEDELKVIISELEGKFEREKSTF
ncbi:HDOD domain-containing protein [Thiospirochaeta perfilievii]|uniref:HDOD domain-containing protein n=1 Tax=Thiospirochaeta perfilievii TaxID=252967 RepID=A0A5C1Q8V2_9SPIO|nr:HDOD domain-containing protein [Thiospirochaeta perfilievii]QEN04495.1 HDOD domain-containing protein [Thiospirochaeta perfilievii]